MLVSDGGGENHAISVDELIASEAHPAITKIIAQRDIRFSNSPIEAINKILKRYLRFHDPRTLEATTRVVAMALHEYSFVRPHGSLKGLIPMQRYIDPTAVPPARHDAAAARALRIEENRTVNCAACAKTTEEER
ncbi:MAG: hypothetical protein IPP83_12130 [Flavobacteriales bacterium]|nr:hypothetical protein [Flavobacteriales bacterium]